MAERRMFTKKIVDSDAFLDMPLSTQCLYFHLNMRADDDGFVNNPKRIQRTIGASEDDLKLLIAKRFLLVFENGVIAIKHWRMHNTLRKDRYSPTQYQEQLQELAIKENGSYTEKQFELPVKSSANQLATSWQPSGNHLETQYSIGKDSIDKYSIEEGNIETDEKEKKSEKLDYQLIADMYNDTCVSFPHIKKLSESRKKAIKARLKTYTVEDFRTLFQKAEASDFLKGKNDRNWIASFDWMIKDSNMVKVLDGNYDNRKSNGSGKKRQFNNFEQRNYDYDALQRMLSNNQNPPKTAADDENIRARAEALKHSLA